MQDTTHSNDKGQKLAAALDEAGIIAWRHDYFDAWAVVMVTDVKKRRVNGVNVTEIVPVKVIIGHEFLAGGCRNAMCSGDEGHAGRHAFCAPKEPVTHNRCHIASYQHEGFWREFIGLGHGMGVAHQTDGLDWSWELYGVNRPWQDAVARAVGAEHGVVA